MNANKRLNQNISPNSSAIFPITVIPNFSHFHIFQSAHWLHTFHRAHMLYRIYRFNLASSWVISDAKVLSDTKVLLNS